MKNIYIILVLLIYTDIYAQNSSTDCSMPITDQLFVEKNVSVFEKQNTSSKAVSVLKQFDKVNVLKKGKSITINGHQDYWYKIGYEKGKSGWILGHYTSLKQEGQRSKILKFKNFSFGDLMHIEFVDMNGKYIDFGSGINNYDNYKFSYDDINPNPKYINKKFKVIYNNLNSKIYCDPPLPDICIEKVPTIIKIKLIN